MMKRLSNWLLCGVIIAMWAISVSAQDKLVLNEPFSGRVNDAYAEFVYTATAGETVFIDVTSNDFDPAFEVYDPNSAFIVSDDNSGDGKNARMGIAFQLDGDYRINITSYSSSLNGNFEIVVTPLEVLTNATINIGDTVQSLLTEEMPVFSFEIAEQTDLLFSAYAYSTSLSMQVRDSAGNIIATNSDSFSNRLPVTLPSGAYTLEIGDLYGIVSINPPFYSVIMQQVDKAEMAYGDRNIIQANGQSAVYATFEGKEGDIFGFSVTSQEPTEYAFSFTIKAPSGVVAFYSENSGKASYIQRGTLTENGTYTVEVTPYNETFSNAITLTLSAMRLLSLDEESQTLVFNDTLISDNAVFTAQANTTYRLTLEADSNQRGYTVQVMNEMTQVLNFNTFGGNRIAIDFISQNAGQYIINIRADVYSNDGSSSVPNLAQVEVSIEAVD
jgi:hypothetical protein